MHTGARFANYERRMRYKNDRKGDGLTNDVDGMVTHADGYKWSRDAPFEEIHHAIILRSIKSRL